MIEGEAVHNDNVNKALRISTGEGGAKDLQYILHFTRPPGVKGGGGGEREEYNEYVCAKNGHNCVVYDFVYS